LPYWCSIIVVDDGLLFYGYRAAEPAADTRSATTDSAAGESTSGLESTTAKEATGRKPTTCGGTQGESVFVQRATHENISNNSTYLDNSLTNGNPDAVLFVTPNWNPGGGRGTYNNHPIGVWYDLRVQEWAIFNQDLAAMSVGAAFNVACG
jgi:hypothetical protein